jgi:hypothetical protein
MPPNGTAATIAQNPEDLRARIAGPDGKQVRSDPGKGG